MTHTPAPPRRQARAEILAEAGSPRRRARQAADEADAARTRLEAGLLLEADARRRARTPEVGPAQQEAHPSAHQPALRTAPASTRRGVDAPATALLRAVPPLAGPLPAPRREALPAATPTPPAGPAGPAIGSTARPVTRPATGRPAGGPAASRRQAPRAPLPWHLRRPFLLPVAVVCLLGSLSGLVLLGATYAHVRAAGGGLADVVLAAADAVGGPAPGAVPADGSPAPAQRTRHAPTARPTDGRPPASAASATAAPAPTAAGTPAAPVPGSTGTTAVPEAASADTASTDAASAPGPETTGGTTSAPRVDRPAPSSTRAPAAAPADQAAPVQDGAPQGVHGDVTYEGFGSARSTSTTYTVDGEFDGSSTLGAAFALPQKGSASWKGWYVAVTASDGGQVGCRIRDAGGAVLVQSTAARPGDTAECAWGSQGDEAPDPEEAQAADDGAPDGPSDEPVQGADG